MNINGADFTSIDFIRSTDESAPKLKTDGKDPQDQLGFLNLMIKALNSKDTSVTTKVTTDAGTDADADATTDVIESNGQASTNDLENIKLQAVSYTNNSKQVDFIRNIARDSSIDGDVKEKPEEELTTLIEGLINGLNKVLKSSGKEATKSIQNTTITDKQAEARDNENSIEGEKLSELVNNLILLLKKDTQSSKVFKLQDSINNFKTDFAKILDSFSQVIAQKKVNGTSVNVTTQLRDINNIKAKLSEILRSFSKDISKNEVRVNDSDSNSNSDSDADFMAILGNFQSLIKQLDSASAMEKEEPTKVEVSKTEVSNSTKNKSPQLQNVQGLIEKLEDILKTNGTSKMEAMKTDTKPSYKGGLVDAKAKEPLEDNKADKLEKEIGDIKTKLSEILNTFNTEMPQNNVGTGVSVSGSGSDSGSSSDVSPNVVTKNENVQNLIKQLEDVRRSDGAPETEVPKTDIKPTYKDSLVNAMVKESQQDNKAAKLGSEIGDIKTKLSEVLNTFSTEMPQNKVSNNIENQNPQLEDVKNLVSQLSGVLKTEETSQNDKVSKLQGDINGIKGKLGEILNISSNDSNRTKGNIDVSDALVNQSTQLKEIKNLISQIDNVLKSDYSTKGDDPTKSDITQADFKKNLVKVNNIKGMADTGVENINLSREEKIETSMTVKQPSKTNTKTNTGIDTRKDLVIPGSVKVAVVNDNLTKEDKLLKSMISSGSEGDKDKDEASKVSKLNTFMSQINNFKENVNSVVPSEKLIINKNNLITDIEKAVKYMNLNDLKEITVKVNPRALGEIIIKLTMESGNMKASISASNKDTYNLLTSNLSDLKGSLGNSDLKIQNVNINIYQEDTTFFNQNFNQSFNQGNRQGNGKRETDTKTGLDIVDQIDMQNDIKANENNISALV